ncbi:hypothetical protein POF51_29695 [Brevibacillus sp. AG]|uniref:hypothetical protein n=1 Tax=Brevibacillus sp. AG TaxID=3020891 RepID=UPI00232E8F36|nr:hypothetical protein [Brevibacillus sp. AG]MDC0764898.1 hypothetical protein [Brevibacillus sp. AG]
MKTKKLAFVLVEYDDTYLESQEFTLRDEFNWLHESKVSVVGIWDNLNRESDCLKQIQERSGEIEAALSQNVHDSNKELGDGVLQSIPEKKEQREIAVFVPVFEDVVLDPMIFTGECAMEEAKNAFLKHTGVTYEMFLQAAYPDELLNVSDTVGTRISVKAEELSVVIEVSGGVAEATQVPNGVSVKIVDGDNPEECCSEND